MLFDEGNITSALARVCNSDGATLGTAFFILPSQGIALTCDHLIPTGGEFVLLDCGDGILRRGRVAKDDRFPAIDLAVISEVEVPHAGALATVSDYQDISRFWTKGFHYYGTEIIDALPTSGRVEGETSTRFSTPAGDYELKDLLVLSTSVIDAGLSGAPVIDPETGVAFALVNAKFGNAPSMGAFAMPFARAQEHAPRLKELFEANTNTVPRFGRFLNRLGALQICRLQRENVIDRLVKRGFFLSDRYCERSEQDAVAKFYSSDFLILPIVGNAGVGKTTLLANIARQPQSRAALFLLARDLRPNETELSAAINSRLREEISDLLGTHGDVSLLISALQSDDRLTVILDGLNEIPVAAAQSLDGWLDRSITWVEKTNTRLIVSSRPEYWQALVNLFPQKRVYQEPTAKDLHVGLSLGDFSEDEAVKVKALYALDPAIPVQHVQHPLIARIYLELQSEVTQAKVVGNTRYQVLQRFIKQKCDRIARAVGLGVLSSHVESFLIEAARITLERGQLELEDKQFFGLFMNDPALADQLVLEGLFMTTSGGKRFSFDEIAEFLQSKALEFNTILKYFSPEKNVPELTAGAIVFALLRLDEQGKGELVSNAIRAIVKGHRLFAGEKEYSSKHRVSESVLPQIVQHMRSPERSQADIATYATRLTSSEGHYWFMYDRFGFQLAIGRSALPLKSKLNLLKMFLLKEDSYEFEHHHWHALEGDVIRARGHTGGIIAELIQSSPVSAFEGLTEWLADPTPLREHKSTVADAAMALMFFYRHLAFEPLCELVIRSQTHKGELLLTYLAKDDQVKMLDLCAKWMNRNDPLLLTFVANMATYLAAGISDDTLQDKVYEILTGIRGRVSEAIDVVATKGIGRLTKYREPVIHKLIDLFKRGDPTIDGYTIAELFKSHFDVVISAVRESIKTNAEQASNAINVLTYYPRSPEELDAIIDLVKAGADNGLLRLHSFRLAIEYLLYQSKGVRNPERVMDLVRHVVAINSDIRLHLTYFAGAALREDINERNLQNQILELLIATTSEDEAEDLLHHLIRTGRHNAEDLKTFLTLQQLLPLDRFHQLLIGGAFTDRGFVEPLLKWLQNGEIAPHGPTHDLLDRVRNGESGDEAIQNIIGL